MLYPELEPFEMGYLNVSTLHSIYYEQSGNPKGIPILFLHGGPGSGTDSNHRRYFDPNHYRIILFDQRGCGKSTPHASTEENTTFHLTDDIEKLRAHLKINRWILFGGSWGSFLALTYAILNPQNVMGLILRGIFFCSKEDLNFFLYEATPKLFPENYEELLSLLNPNENLLDGYHRLLNHPNPIIAIQAAKTWSSYEARSLKIAFDQEFFSRIHDPKKSLSIAKIETHYFLNHAFLPYANWLFDQLNKIDQIPCEIIHGRYDVICPVKNAYMLKKYLPKAKLTIVEEAGHAGSDPKIREALLQATNYFKNLR